VALRRFSSRASLLRMDSVRRCQRFVLPALLTLSACSLLFDETAYRRGVANTDVDSGPSTAVDGGDASVSEAGPSDAGDAVTSEADAGQSDGGVETASDGGTPDSGVCSNDLQTDALNCGRCGHSCLGGQCQAGVCRAFTLATLPTADRWYISGDDSFVYSIGRDGAAGGTHGVLKISKADGSVMPMGLERDQFDVRNSKNFVYWTQDEAPGVLRRLGKNPAGPPETIVQLPAGEIALEFALIDDSYAFVTTLRNVYRVDIAARKADLVGAYPSCEGIDSLNGSVFFVAQNKVYQVDVATNTVSELDSIVVTGRRLQLANKALFVTGYKSGLARLPWGGGTGKSDTQRQQNEGNGWQGIAIDDTHFYWSSADTVFRTRQSDLTFKAEALSTGEAEPVDIHVDGQAIYWINRNTGALRRLAK
jgi:hypothetical protein